MLKISFVSSRTAQHKAIALFVAKGSVLGSKGTALDKQLGGIISRGLKATPSFKGKVGQSFVLHAPSKTGPTLIALVGVGNPAKADSLAYEKAGGVAYKALVSDSIGEGALITESFSEASLDEKDAGLSACFGAQLASYRFDKYRTKSKKTPPKLKSLACITKNALQAKKDYVAINAVSQGVFFTRDLTTEPGNALDPKGFMEAALSLEKHVAKVDILETKELEELEMNALLSVSQGSEKPAYVAVVKWMGAVSEKDRPIAFVGKGVTFDTGGISLKPPLGMENMKFDMGGAGAVLGAMKAIALRKAKTNVIAVIGIVENMPSGNATRPGDVIKSASGQTIEVLNTDAEGRMVLADTLWFVQKHYKPKAIIDIATLTGAMLITFADQYAGLFSNNDDLSFALTDAGESVGEKIWRLPLSKNYDKLLDSPIADMTNFGGRDGGSITAAQFIQRFVHKNIAWAHIDIAGMVWANKASPTCPKGATGFGVRILDRFVADYTEDE